MIAIRVRDRLQHLHIGGGVALTAAGGDDHVGTFQILQIPRYPGIGESKPGGKGTNPLPRLHLPKIALLWNLG